MPLLHFFCRISVGKKNPKTLGYPLLGHSMTHTSYFRKQKFTLRKSREQQSIFILLEQSHIVQFRVHKTVKVVRHRSSRIIIKVSLVEGCWIVSRVARFI